jgi:hypothetical protein
MTSAVDSDEHVGESEKSREHPIKLVYPPGFGRSGGAGPWQSTLAVHCGAESFSNHRQRQHSTRTPTGSKSVFFATYPGARICVNLPA